MRLVRNLGRRKVRTTLTIVGITIGIWALIVFSSMANKISAMVDVGRSHYSGGAISTWAKGSTIMFGGPLAISTGDRVAALDGVEVVVAGVALPLSDEASGVSMGLPPMITGEVAGTDQGRATLVVRYATGRALTAEDEGRNVTVLGSNLARQFERRVGDTIELRGDAFEVVGVLEPTLTQPDGAAQVPLAAAQRLYVATLPPLVAARLVPSEVATGFTVYPKSGADPEAIADEIEAAVPDLSTMTGADFDQQAGSWAAVLNAILVGVALISLVVGGLSVVNTMAMSIAERTREIGIKRAIGGSRFRIVRELVTESALIGFVGGAIGLAAGALVVVLANEAGRTSGTVLFELTASTALSAVAFATILGALAGFLPALRAARLDPVAALRYE